MNTTNHESHTISVYVSNKPGVLARVTQVFTRRGYNIDSLSVSTGQDKAFSRMSITATGDLKVLEQIIKQLTKLIDVITATDHKHQHTIEKELSLIKISASKQTRPEILQLAQHFNSRVVDFSETSVIINIIGSTEKIDALIKMVDPYGIIEIVRTGKILIARGPELT